jgi:hypothetical protein
MLHLNTIDNSTHQILPSLQIKEYLQNFALVGDTNLSLRYGHRKSIDLDMFCTDPFDPLLLSDLLRIDFNYNYTSNNKYMLFGYINNVKIDIVHHPFALLEPLEVIDSTKLFSLADVSAMKLFAVTRRGANKDFYDIFQLCADLGVKTVIENFSKKYGADKVWMMQKSIVYFEEADKEEDPTLLLPITWNQVKKYMKQTFSKPL